MYAQLGHEVLRSELKIINGPVKSVGEYDYILQVHPDLSLQLKFKVMGDQAVEAVEEAVEEAPIEDVTDSSEEQNTNEETDNIDQNDADDVE